MPLNFGGVMAVNIYNQDCMEFMATLPDNSIDAIVTDPPYGLSFMGKKLDYDVPSEEIWRECLRVLKPGGHLLAFAGTRTQHRMAVRIEDAGFEIRDMCAWVYSQGFPKSLDVSKAIDKEAGAEREVVGISGKSGATRSCMAGDFAGGEYMATAPATEAAKKWNGWGTALKPALEPITVARKPLSEKTVAANVQKWGTGAINIDGCRIGMEKIHISGGGGGKGTGWGKKEEINEERFGRFPANLIHDGSQEVLDLFPNSKSAGGTNPCRRASFGDEQIGSPFNYADNGSAARFFKQIPIDNDTLSCYLCGKDRNKEDLCKNTNVHNAEMNLKTIKEITPNTVPQNVIGNLNGKKDQLVRYAGNLCEKCAMSFVQSLAVISEVQKGAQSLEELQVMRDFITNSKKCTLLQNLANYAELMASIDTTPTTTSLLKLFGSANLAITNYIQEIEKTAPKRFLYAPKASKAERNRGCEGLEEKRGGSMMANTGETMGLGGASLKGEPKEKQPDRNNHPTVKPIALMEYLVKLVTREGQTVLDPFAGSGTTGIACKNLNREAILIEREAEYVEIAECRNI